MSSPQCRVRFFDLHARGEVFVMPNPFDVGSARLLAHAGFEALATTSAGFAWSQGRDDYGVTFEALIDHVAALTAAVDVPINVDSERLFADDPEGVAANVRRLHAAGASGCSIEDWNPQSASFDDLGAAVERVRAAASAAHEHHDDPLLLTARCEYLLHGVDDLDGAIERVGAYRDAGADCVYIPGVRTVEQVERIVSAVEAPLNVLALPGGPSVAELGAAGCTRVSTGGSLASTAYGALMRGARELATSGTSSYLSLRLEAADRAALRPDAPD